MTDRKIRAEEIRDHTDDSPRSHRRWTNSLMHRWPTALAVAIAALAAFDLAEGTELVALIVLMPLVYLGAAALDRRRGNDAKERLEGGETMLHDGLAARGTRDKFRGSRGGDHLSKNLEAERSQ